MNNSQEPAFPLVNQEGNSLEDREVRYGFTKIEYASLMIAQGYVASGVYKNDEQEGYEIAKCAVHVAKLVLEEANK